MIRSLSILILSVFSILGHGAFPFGVSNPHRCSMLMQRNGRLTTVGELKAGDVIRLDDELRERLSAYGIIKPQFLLINEVHVDERKAFALEILAISSEELQHVTSSKSIQLTGSKQKTGLLYFKAKERNYLISLAGKSTIQNRNSNQSTRSQEPTRWNLSKVERVPFLINYVPYRNKPPVDSLE